MSSQTTRDIFNKAFARKNNQSFIVFGDSRITYGDLKTGIGRFSSYFRQNGIKTGDRVVFSSADERFACLFYLSLVANGITVVFIDPGSGPQRVRAIISHCRPGFVFIDLDLLNDWGLQDDGSLTVVPVQPEFKGTILQNLLKREKTTAGTFPAEVRQLPETDIASGIDPESDAYILFTSGTTSEPKGVRISHRALFSHLATLASVYRMDEGSRIFNNLILSHADGIVQGPLLALFCGATLYRPFLFSIQHIEDNFDAVYREGITHWVMVPTMMGLILRLMQKSHDMLDTPSFRYVISCGARLETGIWQQFEEKFRTRIINGYGLTETVTGGLFAGPGDSSHVIGTIGKPVDCEAKIVDENGQEKAAGEQGEIWIRGSLLMSGYLDAPEATREAFSGDWFRTGDIGYTGEDGCFRITGRKKQIIISGGMNIFPDEVTEVVNTHPAVRESFTFGVEDPLWGEMVACAIVANNRMTVSSQEIVQFCRNHLEERKVPAKVFFTGELPRGRSGKVIVEKLKEQACGAAEETRAAAGHTHAFFGIVSRCLQMPANCVSMEMVAEDTPAWDSISHLILIAEMEKHYHIEFSPMEVMNINTLADLYDTIHEKKK